VADLFIKRPAAARAGNLVAAMVNATPLVSEQADSAWPPATACATGCAKSDNHPPGLWSSLRNP